MQQQRLEGLGEPVLWHPALTDIPGGPAIIIANEFFDATGYQADQTKPTAGTSASSTLLTPTASFVIGAARDPLPHIRRHLAAGIAPVARGFDL